jgi:hypothetical protein
MHWEIGLISPKRSQFKSYCRFGIFGVDWPSPAKGKSFSECVIRPV